MPKIDLKKVEAADIERVKYIITNTRLEEYYSEDEQNDQQEVLYQFIKDSQKSNPVRFVFGIYVDNILVDFVDYCGFDEVKKKAKLNGFGVDDKYSDNGYGTLLFLFSMHQLDLKKISLSSFFDDCALSFYLSFGFYPKRSEE